MLDMLPIYWKNISNELKLTLNKKFIEVKFDSMDSPKEVSGLQNRNVCKMTRLINKYTFDTFLHSDDLVVSDSKTIKLTIYARLKK